MNQDHLSSNLSSLTSNQPTSWLITGGCGFIGVNLVKFLKERGHRIRVMDNLSGGSREDLAAVTEISEIRKHGAPYSNSHSVALMEGDVRNVLDCREAVKGADLIVHLAAQTGVIPSLENPYFDCEQNVTGTLNMLAAARDAGVERFVFASSAAPLGEQEPPVNEEKLPRPLSPYGASKLAGEAYCSAFHGSFGMETVCLRFSNVYGPYSFKKGSVIAAFFRRALDGKPLIIYGDGSQTRDFIHTEDLCQAILKAAEKDAGGGVFQVATGRETSVKDLAGRIKTLIEEDSKGKVEITQEAPRPGEIKRNYADITRARQVLGYEPAVSLDEGLRETWEWFRTQQTK